MRQMKAITTILSLTLLASCQSDKKVEVSPQRRDITEYVFATGTLEPRDHYNLVAQTEGYLSQVRFRENELVVKNQLMAVINNHSNVVNTVATSEQLKIADYNVTDEAPALKQIKSNINFAEKKYLQDLVQEERYKKLAQSNSVAKVELENATLAVQNSAANLAALRQNYEQLKQQSQQQYIIQRNAHELSKTNKAYNELRPFVGGTVLKRYKQVGDFVKKGDTIASIGNLNSIIAQLNIDEGNISDVKVGQKILIRLNTDINRVFEAKVSEILPVFDENTQSFIVNAVFQTTPGNPVCGTQLEANIEIITRHNVLVIPRELLGFGNKVKVKGSEDLRHITTGIISNDYVEVIGGLNEKDIIIPIKP